MASGVTLLQSAYRFVAHARKWKLAIGEPLHHVKLLSSEPGDSGSDWTAVRLPATRYAGDERSISHETETLGEPRRPSREMIDPSIAVGSNVSGARWIGPIGPAQTDSQ
ncbi:MerR family transcriptional regulator [Anopheles sinensis]|uniref:MerR family transcriptional regulator n=1 Tax=Anopheles sinensis TaxID=74873 RepID=A0A084W2Q1_ANOSI|nr:MerR family transcriptional regulator [Anopheles sinensis]